MVRTQSAPANVDGGDSWAAPYLKEASLLDKYQLGSSSSQRLKLDMIQLASM